MDKLTIYPDLNSKLLFEGDDHILEHLANIQTDIHKFR